MWWSCTTDKEDLASFDTHGAGYYVLEAGEYEVSLRTDAHTVVDAFTFNVASSIVYNESNLHNGDLVVADSKLAFAEGTIEYLSRADGFANYASAAAAPSNYTPMWEDLLDEVTVDEMVQLIAYGGFATVEVPSIKKVATLDSDGPAGVNYSVSGLFGMGYCGEILLAQTWNTDLAYKMGDGICQEFEDFGRDGWYAPSMNLHRSLFAGRNFEYYSEDPLLSGRMAVQECEAAYTHGVYPYIKHFAFNEQETNRNGMLCTWLTEQSARELYLKPFEDCVKANQSQALAVMSSYVYVGTTWDGGCSALLNDILRGEWGYKGLVLTDYFGNYGYMDADKAIRGGSDIMLGTAGNDAILTDQTSAASVLAMRQATKNILYSSGTNGRCMAKFWANGDGKGPGSSVDGPGFFLCPPHKILCDFITVKSGFASIIDLPNPRGGSGMETRIKRRAVVDGSACVACGCCMKVCPLSAIQIWRGVRAVVNADKCVGCGKCAKECPASVIEIQEVRP